MNILKYPGSKWNIAHWIVSHFPIGYERLTYIEPFFGSGAVFFTKERSIIETINDLDDEVVNLFQVARDCPEELARAVRLTPWARTEYRLSYDRDNSDKVENARKFLVRMWQGIGARSSYSTGWRKNVKGINGNVPKFHTNLPDSILAICERLKHASGSYIVQIENRDAFELIERHNTSDTLMYIDPPYVMETKNNRVYKHEFCEADHLRILGLAKKHKGCIAISGYSSSVYEESIKDWWRYETVCQTEAANKRTEILWCNYEAQEQMQLWT